MLFPTVLDIIDFYLDLDLVLNKISLELDLYNNRIVVIKNLFYTMNKLQFLCLKITIVITISYTFDVIRCYLKMPSDTLF